MPEPVWLEPWMPSTFWVPPAPQEKCLDGREYGDKYLSFFAHRGQETNKTKYPGLQIAGRRTDLGLEESLRIRKRIHIQQRTQQGIIDSWYPLRCHTKVSPSHRAFLVIGIDCFMRKAMISRATDLDGMDTTVTNPGSFT